jgi:hypothetical protein
VEVYEVRAGRAVGPQQPSSAVHLHSSLPRVHQTPLRPPEHPAGEVLGPPQLSQVAVVKIREQGREPAHQSSVGTAHPVGVRSLTGHLQLGRVFLRTARIEQGRGVFLVLHHQQGGAVARDHGLHGATVRPQVRGRMRGLAGLVGVADGEHQLEARPLKPATRGALFLTTGIGAPGPGKV